MSVISIPEGSCVLSICPAIIYLFIIFVIHSYPSLMKVATHTSGWYLQSCLTVACQILHKALVWVHLGLLCSADLDHFFTSLTGVMNPPHSINTQEPYKELTMSHSTRCDGT